MTIRTAREVAADIAATESRIQWEMGSPLEEGPDMEYIARQTELLRRLDAEAAEAPGWL